jgi:hypothetical protein
MTDAVALLRRRAEQRGILENWGAILWGEELSQTSLLMPTLMGATSVVKLGSSEML